MQIALLVNEALQAVVDWPAVPRVGDQLELPDGVAYDVVQVVWFLDYLQVNQAYAPVVVFCQTPS